MNPRAKLLDAPKALEVFHYNTIEFRVLDDQLPYSLKSTAHHEQLLHQTDALQCVAVVVLQKKTIRNLTMIIRVKIATFNVNKQQENPNSIFHVVRQKRTI